MNISKEEVLIVCALEQEAQSMLGGWNVIYTGIGKVNAAYILTRFLSLQKPRLVINYGTAGSKNLDIGTLVDCTKFIQRDMDKTPLGFIKGETPFEPQIPMVIDCSETEFNTIGKNCICGTGDNFVQDASGEIESVEVFDMEAYALAKVCAFFEVPFISYKYITDNADENSHKDWQENITDGIQIFKEEVLNKIK